MTSPVRLGVCPAGASIPTGVFNHRFEALFPQAGALGCAVCFAPPLFLPVYLSENMGPRGLLAVALPAHSFHNPPLWVWPRCHGSFTPQLPVSALPTGLDECLSFISLVVGLPCSSVFCQFLLFSVFKLLLSLFWLCEEAQCVYLHLHLGFFQFHSFRTSFYLI